MCNTVVNDKADRDIERRLNVGNSINGGLNAVCAYKKLLAVHIGVIIPTLVCEA